MATNTEIEWTDVTWNPTRGCSRKSKGCESCYAERQARRFAFPGGPYEGLLHPSGAWSGKIRLVEHLLTAPLSWSKGQRVFVDSMSDLFHENIPFEFVDKVFAVMSATDRHTYQILTKRPERALEWFARLTPDPTFGMEAGPEEVNDWKVKLRGEPQRGNRGGYDNCGLDWPLRNVWLGVSVEDQATCDERVPLLLQLPAAVRFLSCEPLLEDIDLSSWTWGPPEPCANCPKDVDCECGWKTRKELGLPAIDWIIAGGESGPGARRFDIAWARDLVRHGRQADVPVFVKQLGARPTWDGCAQPGEHWPEGTEKLDGGRGYWEIRLRDRKGGDMAEWPEDLRVRELPR